MTERIPRKPARKLPRGNGEALTKEEYDSLWRLYVKGKTMRQISIATGISWNVVSKYVKQGDKRRNLEPLKDRLVRVRRQSMDVADRQAVQTRARVYRQAQTQLGNAMSISILATNRLDDYRKMHSHEDRETGRTVFHRPSEEDKEGWRDEDFSKLLTAQEKAARNVDAWQTIFQNMASWGQHDEGGDFRGWTTEELERFAETGELPERMLTGEKIEGIEHGMDED